MMQYQVSMNGVSHGIFPTKLEALLYISRWGIVSSGNTRLCFEIEEIKT